MYGLYLIALIVGVFTCIGLGTVAFLGIQKLSQINEGKKLTKPSITIASSVLTVFILAVTPLVSFAQSTPVTFDLPMEDMIAQSNSWMGTFSPIFSMSGGLQIALALLGMFVSVIVGAIVASTRGRR